MTMTLLLAFLSSLLATGPALAIDQSDQAGAPVPQAADADSIASFDPARFRGHVVLLDFWASWCGPCSESFPWLAQMQERYREAGLVVVGVNLDRDRKAADRFLAKHPVPFEIVYDPKGALATAWQIEAMPSSFLLDRGGKRRLDHQGFRKEDAAALDAEIRALLNENAPEDPAP